MNCRWVFRYSPEGQNANHERSATLAAKSVNPLKEGEIDFGKDICSLPKIIVGIQIYNEKEVSAVITLALFTAH